ncbi:MAG: hypothetical protein ABWY04_12945 [Arthrobacter sp.]
MKKWIAAHRKMVALVVLVVFYAAGVALFVSWGHEMADTLFTAVSWFVITVVLWFLDARRQRKTSSRLESAGGMLAYIRYPDSLPGSLSGIWNMGVATFDGRVMKFQPAVYDTLEPSGRPTTFRAMATVPTEPREIDRKERNYVTQREFQAIRLTTDKGDIEVVAGPKSLRRILDTLRQDEETS